LPRPAADLRRLVHVLLPGRWRRRFLRAHGQLSYHLGGNAPLWGSHGLLVQRSATRRHYWITPDQQTATIPRHPGLHPTQGLTRTPIAATTLSHTPSISHPPSLPLHGEGESVGTDNLYNPFPNATRWPSLQSFSSSDSTWRSVATPYETLAYSTLPISTDSKYCNRRHASNASGALNIPRWASITVPSLLALNKTPDPCLWKLQMSLLSTRLPPFGIPLSSNCLNPQLGLQSVNTNLACTSANIRICSIAFDIIAGPFLLRLLWDNSVFGPAACISGGG
jgi:hypothetical protein